MRQWIDLVESINEKKRSDILTAIFRHIKQHVDPDMTREEFNGTYHTLREHLKFPLKIYRAMSFEEADVYYDAHADDINDLEEEDRERLIAAIHKIDFDNIGVCWTFNKESAVAGGIIGGGAFNHDGAHVIFEATIPSKSCDILATLYHNLTVYQEEEEIRLFHDVPLTITGMYPDVGLQLPMRANSGKESYYSRDSILNDLTQAMRETKR